MEEFGGSAAERGACVLQTELDGSEVALGVDQNEKAVLSGFKACPRGFDAILCGREQPFAEELEDVPRFGEMLARASHGESDLILDTPALVLCLG